MLRADLIGNIGDDVTKVILLVDPVAMPAVEARNYVQVLL